MFKTPEVEILLQKVMLGRQKWGHGMTYVILRFCNISQAFTLHTVHNQRRVSTGLPLQSTGSSCPSDKYMLKRRIPEEKEYRISFNISVKINDAQECTIKRLNLAINSINIKVTLLNSMLALYPGCSFFFFTAWV